MPQMHTSEANRARTSQLTRADAAREGAFNTGTARVLLDEVLRVFPRTGGLEGYIRLLSPYRDGTPGVCLG